MWGITAVMTDVSREMAGHGQPQETVVALGWDVRVQVEWSEPSTLGMSEGHAKGTKSVSSEPAMPLESQGG